jgi:4-aminobutyrate aminotransferase-like enzyme
MGYGAMICSGLSPMIDGFCIHNVIRFISPLNIDDSLLEQVLNTLEEALKKGH